MILRPGVEIGYKKSMERINKFQGVYQRTSETRRHQGKPDRCFYFSFKDGDKKVWEKAGWLSEGITAQMASNLRAERLRDLRHGKSLPSKKQAYTLSQVWERYDKLLETNRKSPEIVRYGYGKHLKPRFAHKLMHQITPEMIDKMKIELQEQGLAPATVKHQLVLLRHIFNKAILWEMFNGENPIKKVSLPKLDNNRVRFFSKEQAKILFNELKERHPQLHDIAFMSLATGMRAGKILSLRWENVDLESQVIRIVDDKGGESLSVFINDSLLKLLQEYDNKEIGSFVFPNSKGMELAEVSRIFSEIVDDLGFNDGVKGRRDRLTFHSLRHTFASWLALEGTPLLTIKELLGHKAISMTERYSHLIPDVKKAAVEKITLDTRVGGN